MPQSVTASPSMPTPPLRRSPRPPQPLDNQPDGNMRGPANYPRPAGSPSAAGAPPSRRPMTAPRRFNRPMGPPPRPTNNAPQTQFDVRRSAREIETFEQVMPVVKPGDETKLKVYALGGLEEVGRNCTVFEMGDDIVIVDIGLMFPEEGMPGIDYIIPDISGLRGKEKNIRGIVVTHGHMDHIGGISHLVPKLGNPPIYTAPLTAGIIRNRHEEYTNAPKLNMVIVQNADERFHLGKHFVFEPFHINHNISDAFGAALHTPFGTIIITGDFKFDYSPINEEPADLNRIALFGYKGVLALMSDSTSAEVPGHQISEQVVADEMDRIVSATKGRIIIGTFASLLTRVQIILTLCEKYGRRVLIQGRSMQKNIELAHELGYLKYKPGIFLDESEVNKYPEERMVVLCTGAQGEKNAALMRIATGEHRLLTLHEGDTVIFSSSVIPGNERTVQRLKDTIVRRGARVVHYANMDVHAGGHAKQEDLKLMMRLTKPKYFIPIHGNRFMLYAHGNLAEQVGIPLQNIFVADNGQIMEFDATGGRLTEDRIPTEHVMVDGLGVGDVSEVVLRDRVQMSEDGMFVVIATIEARTGELIGNPDIISRGFIFMKENKEIIEKARALVRRILEQSDHKAAAFDEFIKNKIRNDVGQFLFSQTKRRPMVLPVIIEV